MVILFIREEIVIFLLFLFLLIFIVRLLHYTCVQLIITELGEFGKNFSCLGESVLEGLFKRHVVKLVLYVGICTLLHEEIDNVTSTVQSGPVYLDKVRKERLITQRGILGVI